MCLCPVPPLSLLERTMRTVLQMRNNTESEFKRGFTWQPMSRMHFVIDIINVLQARNGSRSQLRAWYKSMVYKWTATFLHYQACTQNAIKYASKLFQGEKKSDNHMSVISQSSFKSSIKWLTGNALPEHWTNSQTLLSQLCWQITEQIIVTSKSFIMASAIFNKNKEG